MSDNALIQLLTSESVAADLHRAMQGLTPQQRLSQFIQLFSLFTDLQERSDSVLEVVCRYFINNEVWKPSFRSLNAFQQAGDWQLTISSALERAVLRRRRITRVTSKLSHRWGARLEETLPPDIAPSSYSEGILRQLNRLSQSCDREEAILLLREQVQRRLSNWGGRLRTTEHVTTADVQMALLELHQKRLSEVTGTSHSVLPAPIPFLPDHTMDVEPTVTGPPLQTSLRGKSIQPSVENERNVEMNLEDKDTSGAESESESESESSSGEMNMDESQEVATCSCPQSLIPQLALLNTLGSGPDDPRGSHIFQSFTLAQIQTFCRPHLRTFVSSTVGLRNNITTSEIINRVQQVHSSISDLLMLRVNNLNWFLKSHHVVTEAKSLVIYRHPPVPRPPFEFDSCTVFGRFAGPFCWNIWERDGTIILGDALSHLNNDAIRRGIDLDFDIYRHHYRPDPNRTSMGFLRNMFHGLTQQLVRQDPVWYALMTAARPDKNWRLISYPYIAKDADDGDRTGFLHLDLNMREYIKPGQGINMLTSSVSLDDEQADGCTTVVPGFHHHIGQWHERRIARGDDTAGTTTNCKTQYRTQDRNDWGQPVPSPCPAYGIRITRPEIIHGSTSVSSRRRRVIYTWLTGIQEDHLTLDNPNSLNWEQVSACHRDLEAPSTGVGGEKPTHSVPPFRFPAAIYMESAYALGDALVGRRKWTDPEVLEQRDILLGDDHELAMRFVGEARRALVDKFLSGIGKLRGLETRAFGPNSFFVSRDTDVNMA